MMEGQLRRMRDPEGKPEGEIRRMKNPEGEIRRTKNPKGKVEGQMRETGTERSPRGEIRRVVVKIGTSSLTYENGKINLHRMDSLCRVLTDLRNRGMEVLLVTSGAIGVGFGRMGLTRRPTETQKRQALAAIGQCELMYMYDRTFGDYGQAAAQVLLTKEVTDAPVSRKNVENTLEELLQMGVIPVINENDTVETAELEGEHFGDNDMLSAIVAEIVGADALLILTDTEGLYNMDPRKHPEAEIIPFVPEITAEIEALAGGEGTQRGTGGMTTKLRAAKYVTLRGISCHIFHGKRVKKLYGWLEGEALGTMFCPRACREEQ